MKSLPLLLLFLLSLSASLPDCLAQDVSQRRDPVQEAIEVADERGVRAALAFLDETLESRRRPGNFPAASYHRSRVRFVLRLYETDRVPLGNEAHEIVLRALQRAGRGQSDPRLHHLEGLLQESYGRTDEAQLAYTRALEIDPDHAASIRGFEKLDREARKRQRFAERRAKSSERRSAPGATR